MRLIIAEKPSMARDIARAVGNASQRDGYLECRSNTLVTWCYGHLLEQAPPEEYDPAFKSWDKSAEQLPIVPSEWKLRIKRARECRPGDYRPDKGAKIQLETIKRLALQSTEIVHAGDAGREGQLLVQEVLDYLSVRNKAVRRLWLSSLTEEAIGKALAQMRDNQSYRPLHDAALARSRADWLIGMNLTRAMTVNANRQGLGRTIHVGRVQTPTLAIVVERDREIDSFVPKDYFVPVVVVRHSNGTFEAKWIPREDAPLDPEGRLLSRDFARRLVAMLSGVSGTVSEYESQIKNKAPPLPFSLTSLQRRASARFGFSAEHTLDVAQRLYEGPKLITYPRTECAYLTLDLLKEAGATLKVLAAVGYEAAAGANSALRSAAWNDEKVGEHHAIIPTGRSADIGKLDDDERAIFGLIVEAYIRQFYPPKRYEARSAIVEAGRERWRASGSVVIEPGWTAVRVLGIGAGVSEPCDDEDDTALPEMHKGDGVTCIEARVDAKKTEPPPRFTDGTLVDAMESVHRFVTHAEIKKRLKETSGLGTVATRANIIEHLVDRGYLARKKRQLISTPLGRELIDLVPAPLREPGLTAFWEEQLDAIAKGNAPADQFMASQVKILRRLIQDAFGSKFTGGVAPTKCPQCSSLMKRRTSKGNKNFSFWVCEEVRHGRTLLFVDEGGTPGREFGGEALRQTARSHARFQG